MADMLVWAVHAGFGMETTAPVSHHLPPSGAYQPPAAAAAAAAAAPATVSSHTFIYQRRGQASWHIKPVSDT